MEYNLDGMAPLPKPNIFKQAWQGITSPHYGRTISFLTLLVIVALVPATIVFLGQQTNIKQKASEQLPSDPNFLDGKIEVFNARGDAVLSTNAGPATNSTSNTVQLKITSPNGSTLGLVQKSSPIAYSPINNIIQKAYADSACPGTCKYPYDSGTDMYACTQYPQGVGSDCAGFPSHGMKQVCNDDSCTDQESIARCYTGCRQPGSPPGGGGAPSATPVAPSATPVAGGGSGILPVPGTQTNGATVRLQWNTTAGATHYHVRVNNTQNQTTQAINVSREPTGCSNTLFVCTDTGANNWLDLVQLPNGNYDWWVDVDGHQVAHSNFNVTGAGGGGAPSATPVAASPSTQIVQIDIQNLPDTDTTGSPRKTIKVTDGTELSDILNGRKKVGWDIPLPIFDQNLTTQTKTVEVTFWYAGNRADGKNYVKKTQTVTYAPFVMRFSTNAENTPPQVGKPLHAYVYGNSGALNVGLNFDGSATIDTNIVWSPTGLGDPSPCATKACVISKMICSDPPTNNHCQPDPSDKVIAWKFPIPQERINAAANRQLVVAFTSNNPTNPVKHVEEAVYISPAGTVVSPTPTVAGAPTATGVPDAAPTATGTPIPTVTPGGPTLTPTPTGAPIPTPTLSVTPPPPGPASVSFKVILAGIGPTGAGTHGDQAIWNPTPLSTIKQVTVYLYEPDADPSTDPTGQSVAIPLVIQPQGLTWDGTGGTYFKATNLNLGTNIVPGKQYQMLIKVPMYLRKHFSGIITINPTPNTPTIINQVLTLIPGDADNNNAIDALDYNAYRTCLNQNQQTPDCVAKTDFNGDNQEDTIGNQLDYRLFAWYFGTKSGD